jgi:hypothetical protein
VVSGLHAGIWRHFCVPHSRDRGVGRIAGVPPSRAGKGDRGLGTLGTETGMSTDTNPHDDHSRYLQDLTDRLWRYRESRFAGQDHLFDQHVRPSPPVFAREHALRNVIVRPDTPADEREGALSEVSGLGRHRWLGSMRSSQALAWSVFASLKASGKTHLLARLRDDRGLPLFGPTAPYRLDLERPVSHLGEPQPTSLDAMATWHTPAGAYVVATECKLTETDVGTCSRPRLRPRDGASYQQTYCDGTYSPRMGRAERCALSGLGVRYWRHVPALFRWPADGDLRPCPLDATYQLVRNVLAACVRADGAADGRFGHAVLLYDDRNPSFAPGGRARDAVASVLRALRDPTCLRLGTWQQVASVLAGDSDLAWLAGELAAKYGF